MARPGQLGHAKLSCNRLFSGRGLICGRNAKAKYTVIDEQTINAQKKIREIYMVQRVSYIHGLQKNERVIPLWSVMFAMNYVNLYVV